MRGLYYSMAHCVFGVSNLISSKNLWTRSSRMLAHLFIFCLLNCISMLLILLYCITYLNIKGPLWWTRRRQVEKCGKKLYRGPTASSGVSSGPWLWKESMRSPRLATSLGGSLCGLRQKGCSSKIENTSFQRAQLLTSLTGQKLKHPALPHMQVMTQRRWVQLYLENISTWTPTPLPYPPRWTGTWPSLTVSHSKPHTLRIFHMVFHSATISAWNSVTVRDLAWGCSVLYHISKAQTTFEYKF